MRPVPPAAVEFIKSHEQLRLTGYLDSGGVPTDGWGNTGPEVKVGRKITLAQAERDLAGNLAEAQAELYRVVKAEVLEGDLTDHQYGALISFVFNLGAKSNWTIWKRLNARQFDQVPLEMMRFVYDQDPKTGKMRKVSGLVNRRAEEVKFWSTEEPGSEDVRLTSASLRSLETPPALSDPVPARKSAGIWTAITAPFLGAWVMVKEWLGLAPDWLKHAIEIVNPFSTQSSVVQHMVAGLATAAAVVGVVNAVLQAQKKREAAR